MGCDNWAASKIITLGSMKPECHEVAKAIVKLVMEFDIVLEPFWLSRESREIKVCDALSKDFNIADYRLSGQDFSMLQDRFGSFSVDFFGSSFTARCRPFFALVDCAGAAGVDAFSADWGTWRNDFFHLPVGLVAKVLRYAECCGASTLLVVPDWPGSVYMARLREKELEGRVARVLRFEPRLEAPAWMKSNVFRGTPNFNFLAYTFSF